MKNLYILFIAAIFAFSQVNAQSLKQNNGNKIQSSFSNFSLRWCTYYISDIKSMVVDRKGNIIVAGNANSHLNISTKGAFQENDSGYDMIVFNDPELYTYGSHSTFISKFTPNGKRLWSTYFGGPGTDGITGLCVDSTDNIIISGYTTSKTGIVYGNSFQSRIGSDSLLFYDYIPTPGYYRDVDYFISKFSSEGEMLWSTYLGGEKREGAIHIAPKIWNGKNRGYSCNQSFGASICTDSYSNIYFTGSTLSEKNIATKDAFKQRPELIDALICKISPFGEKLWATYFGGEGDDMGYAINCDKDNDVIITGMTSSYKGISSSEAYQTSKSEYSDSNSYDWYIAKFDGFGMRKWGTYLGGNGNEYFISLALSGNDIFIAGGSFSNDLPEKDNAFKKDTSSNSYIAGFSKDGDLKWGTYYKHATRNAWQYSNDAINISVDNFGNLLLFSTANSDYGITTKGALKQNLEKEDVLIVIMDKMGRKLGGSFWGSNENEFNTAGVAGKNGNIYFGGKTKSNFGIATPGSFRDDNKKDTLNSYIAALNFQLVRQISGDTTITIHIAACDGAVGEGVVNISNISEVSLYISPKNSYFVNKTPGLSLENKEDSLRIDSLDSVKLKIKYSFQPGSPSIIRDTLVIPHSDFFMGDTAWRVAIEIIIDPPDISLSKNTIDFGSIPSCLSLMDSVTLTNKGPCPIVITKETILEGGNPEEFNFANGTKFPDTIPSFGSRNYYIEFRPRPKSFGDKSATLQFASDQKNLTIPLIILTGHIDTLRLKADPPSVKFGIVNAGSNGFSKLLIYNYNNFPVNIKNIEPVISKLTINPPNAIIPKNGYMSFDFEWKPDVSGDLDTIIKFIIDSPCPDTLNIEVYGRVPKTAMVHSENIDFGKLAYCESVIDTLHIENTGELDIEIVGIDDTDDLSNKWGISILYNEFPKTLKPGEKLAVPFKLDMSKKSVTFMRVVYFNAIVDLEKKSYPVKVFAEFTSLSASLQSATFPLTDLGITGTQKIVFHNYSEIPVVIENAFFVGHSGIFGINPNPVNQEVKASDSAMFDVTFTPLSGINYVDSLRFNLSMKGCKDSLFAGVSGMGKAGKSVIHVSMPDTTAKVGDEFCIPVYGHTEKGEATGKFETLIEMANDIFEPIIPYSRTTSNLTVALNGDVHFTETDTKIAEICGQILLSNVVKSPLKFDSFTFSDPDAEIIKKDGSLTITGACMPNLQKITMSEPLKMSIRPNPAGDIIKLAISSQKDNAISLTITDVLGRLTYTSNIVSSGNDEVTIDASQFGSGIYRLNASSYYGSGNVMLQVVN